MKRLDIKLINAQSPYKVEAADEEYSLRPFTKEELNARIDQAEAEIAAGLGTPHEEVMREMDEEIERWEQEELEMAAQRARQAIEAMRLRHLPVCHLQD